MEHLKQQFIDEELTCLVVQNDILYKEKNHGVKPLLSFIEQGILKQSTILDKVIGKAAAMLMIYGGVSRVYAFTISEHALSCFEEHHIPVTYETLVPYIINRKKDGMCPMEATVLTCQNIEEAYQRLMDKVASMK